MSHLLDPLCGTIWVVAPGDYDSGGGVAVPHVLSICFFAKILSRGAGTCFICLFALLCFVCFVTWGRKRAEGKVRRGRARLMMGWMGEGRRGEERTPV